jgi:hypothetical protein
MNEQLQRPGPGSIEDARAEAAAAQARLAERAAKFGFTPGQQAVFDAEFERLRDDVSRRKKILALPSLKSAPPISTPSAGQSKKSKRRAHPSWTDLPVFSPARRTLGSWRATRLP